MPASAPDLTSSQNLHHIAVLSLASVAIGAWELAITRVASVLFFYEVAYLVLALCLFGIGVGALIARRLPGWLTINILFFVLLVSMPIGYLSLNFTEWAWRFLLFIAPFVVFGCLSALVWRRITRLDWRSWLYTTELLGALIGLLLVGPTILTQLPINVLGDIGVLTHLKVTVATEGLVYHEHATNSAARTDLVETGRPGVRYIFTDGMFVTRSVAWDGKSSAFDDPYVEDLSRLKRLAFRINENNKVALLGAGAGFDIAIAIQEGAHDVTAIEVNADTIRFARRFDDWAGGVLNHEKVELVVSEARRYMQRSQSHWDHINLTLLQTSPASLRGVQHVDARVLTLEAVQLYLSRLDQSGVVTIIQNTAALASATEGVVEAAVNFDQRRLLRFKVSADEQNSNPFAYLFVLSTKPFSDAQIETVERHANQLGIESVTRFGSLAMTPATDDQPFLFVSDARVSLQASLILTFALLAVAIGLFMQPGGTKVRSFALAAMFSGASAMAVQVVAIYWCQGAIGNPVLAMAVALSSVLAGSGVGVALFGRLLTFANGWRSGLFTAASIGLLLVLMPVVARLALGYSDAMAALILSVAIVICSVPLGLPFIATMQFSQRVPHGEGVIVGFDGLGALLGVASATLLTLMLGYTALGYATIAGFLFFAAILHGHAEELGSG